MAHKGIPLGTTPAGGNAGEAPTRGRMDGKLPMAKMALPKFAMNKTVLAGVAGVAILVIGGAAVMAGGGKPKAGAYTYETVTVERGTVSRVVSASGAVQPKERVDVGSEVSGKIVDVKV